MRLTSPRVALSVGIIVCLVATGCGDSGLVIVKGRILEDGEPIKVGPRERFGVSLAPYSGAAGLPDDLFGANTNDSTGTFEVRGPDGKGILPGKYRICVSVKSQSSGNDRLKGAFSLEKSPIIRDVTGEFLEIDLSKPGG